jgi:hypothetical protein
VGYTKSAVSLKNQAIPFYECMTVAVNNIAGFEGRFTGEAAERIVGALLGLVKQQGSA